MTNQLQPRQRQNLELRVPAIEKYAYCLCLHVRPTTIFIAVFKLIRALLFASILLNTEIAVNEQVNDYGMAQSIAERHRSTAIAADILRRIIMASVSAVGIYAVISGRAALLMPLYAVLLIDFFFTLTSFSTWNLDPSLTEGLSEFKSYSYNNNAYTRYTIMLLSTITVLVEIYFLCVVWKCYRYLRLIEIVSPMRLSEIYPHIHQTTYPIVRVLGSGDSTDIVSGHNIAPPPYESIASNTKPPNYEEAMKSSNMTVINPANLASQPQQTFVVNDVGFNDQSTPVRNADDTVRALEHRELGNNVVVSLSSDGIDTTNGNVSSSTSESDHTITNSTRSKRTRRRQSRNSNLEQKPADSNDSDLSATTSDESMSSPENTTHVAPEN